MMRLVAALLVMVGSARVTGATMITVHFTGQVSLVEQGDFNALPPISAAEEFSGWYRYDGSVSLDPFHQEYRFDETHPIMFELTIADTRYFLDGNPFQYGGSPFYSRMELVDDFPELLTFFGMSVVAESEMGYRQAIISSYGGMIVEEPSSGILGDAPVPTLRPDAAAGIIFIAHPTVQVSPERIVPGIEPGGMQIYIGGQVYTHFPAVYKTGSHFEGAITSMTVPELSPSFLIALALLAARARREWTIWFASLSR
jgi:hypothetical protein